jgi:hypothetical protein
LQKTDRILVTDIKPIEDRGNGIAAADIFLMPESLI